MKYNEGAQLDPSQMGGGGGRRGGGIAIGGGAGILVVLLALLFGINPGDILGGQQAGPDPTGGATPFAQCTPGVGHQQGPGLPLRGVHQLDPGVLG